MIRLFLLSLVLVGCTPVTQSACIWIEQLSDIHWQVICKQGTERVTASGDRGAFAVQCKCAAAKDGGVQ